MRYQNIVCDKQDHICSLVLGPEVSWAITSHTAAEIEDACDQIRQDVEIRAVLVTIDSGESSTENTHAGTGAEFRAPDVDPLFRYDVPGMIAAIESPVIAALKGDTGGFGLALALACDLRIASDQAIFAVSDVARARFFPVGLTQRLPRSVGRSRAMEMLLTGAPVVAAEALRIGLVHRLVPPAEVVPEARNLTQEIASRAPVAVRYVKEAINKGMDMTLDQGLRLECDLYMILQTTQDRVEGITAFRDKRQPFFRGQ